jgi:hypothetical protein
MGTREAGPAKPDVVRALAREALIKKDFSVLQEREQLLFVQLPASWVAQGRVQPSFRWTIDWDAVRTGATSPPPLDRLHGALEAVYTREALKVLAHDKSPSWWMLIGLRYDLLSAEELATRPWDAPDASCRTMTEAGELIDAAPADLSPTADRT